MYCARNIITANFSGGTSTTTAPLWQWDYGQVLCVTGIEDLPAAFEVHFSTNRAGGVSTVAVGADGQVTIPNVLLTIGKNLNAWIYLSDSEGEGETEYSITIPVKARPMPETYDAEATGVFDDVVRQVSGYAETAQTAANNAGARATAAATSASEAAASATDAAASATAAQAAKESAALASRAASTAAQDAKRSADAAAEDAGEAAVSAHAALTYRDEAQAAATDANDAKAAAQTAAGRAESAATAAGNAATGAGQAASAAAQSATAAAGSATTAQTAAQTATTKAGEASASATAAAASETAAQTARQGAETAETNAGQSASTATTKAAEAAQSASGAAASETAAEAAATRAERAAATLTVDTALSDTSTNPVQNKVITGELTDVKSALEESGTLTLTWERGNISNSTGANTNNARYIRTAEPVRIVNTKKLTLTLDGSYSSAPIVTVYYYDSTGTYIPGGYVNKTASATVDLPSGTRYVRFKLSTGVNDTTTVIDPADGNDLLQVGYTGLVDVPFEIFAIKNGKLDQNAGAGNAGKIMVVDTGGDIVPGDFDLSNSVKKYTSFLWVMGYISSSGGASGSTNDAYRRTAYPQPVKSSTIHLDVDDDYIAKFCAYASDGTFLGITTYTGTNIISLSGISTYYIYIHNSASTTIPDSAVDSVRVYDTIGISDAYDAHISNMRNGFICFSMFKTLGVVGDSWASGSIHHPNGSGADTYYDMSWPQILARRAGITATNFSKGGLSTKTWLENTTYGLSALLAADPQDLYICNLGINDNTQIKAGTLALGSIEDVNVSDYTQNPDTFYGDYGRIIGNIKAHAPNALIIILSVARPGERIMDTHIKAIADKYGIPYIDLTDSEYFISQPFWGSIYDGHPLAYGYAGMATAIAELLSEYISKHPDYFANYD